MRANINKTPRQWLNDIGEDQEETDKILATFQADSTLRVYSYYAPHLFLRAHGKSSRRAIFEPNYWADGSALASSVGHASQFEGFLSDEEAARIAKTYYREITAICHNWNPLASDSFWQIKLQGTERVEGLEGPAAPQPTHDADKRTNTPASDSMLRGGGIQVFLDPRTPFVCTPVNWGG